MVFSQLSAHEKDAFFGLLDEFRNPLIIRICHTALTSLISVTSRYFASRPDLLSNIAKSQAVNSAANAAHDAFKNPTTRKAALDTVKSGMSSARTNWNAAQEASPEPVSARHHWILNLKC